MDHEPAYNFEAKPFAYIEPDIRPQNTAIVGEQNGRRYADHKAKREAQQRHHRVVREELGGEHTQHARYVLILGIEGRT